MANLNNVPRDKILNWVKDYSILCRKHELFLVIDDAAWLQYPGEELDLAEVESNMLNLLIQD